MFFTSLYLPLVLIVCRCNCPLLTELKVWSSEKILSIRVQVNRKKHAANNIETFSYTCVKLRNCATCWLEKFVWIWKIMIAKVWLTTYDNSCLCSFANLLYKFSFSPVAWNILTLVSATKAVDLCLIENLISCPVDLSVIIQPAFLP